MIWLLFAALLGSKFGFRVAAIYYFTLWYLTDLISK